jgi:TolA-binding protein
MDCATCEDRLIDLLYEELEPDQAEEARSHLAQCEACQSSYEGLADAHRLVEAMPMEPAPASAHHAIMAAARAKAAGEATAGAASRSQEDEHRGPAGAFLDWLRGLALGPQVAMATVMLLMVAIGLWHVPQEGGVREGSEVVVAPDPAGEAAPSQEVASVPASRGGNATSSGAPSPGAPSPVAPAEEVAQAEEAMEAPKGRSAEKRAQRAEAPSEEKSGKAQRRTERRAERRAERQRTVRRRRASAPPARSARKEAADQLAGLRAAEPEAEAEAAEPQASRQRAAPAPKRRPQASEADSIVGGSGALAEGAPAPAGAAGSAEAFDGFGRGASQGFTGNTRATADDEESAEASAEAAPRGTRASYQEGLALYRQRRYRQAAAVLADVAYRPAPDAKPVVPNALHYLARSRRARGRCALAAPDYQRLLQRHRSYSGRPQAMIELAQCLERLGRDDEAERWYAEATSFSATSETARRSLQRLRRSKRAPADEAAAQEPASAQ